jgi:hypothetical protein
MHPLGWIQFSIGSQIDNRHRSTDLHFDRSFPTLRTRLAQAYHRFTPGAGLASDPSL